MFFITLYVVLYFYIIREVVVMADKKEATFVVHINKCENDSWQGQVTWADRDEKINFRSAMELMNIMDSALDSEE